MCLIFQSIPGNPEDTRIHQVVGADKEREGNLIANMFGQILTVEQLDHDLLPGRSWDPIENPVKDRVPLHGLLLANLVVVVEHARPSNVKLDVIRAIGVSFDSMLGTPSMTSG